jgi:hypothetical protein
MMELHYAIEQDKQLSKYYQRLKRENNSDYVRKEIKRFDENIARYQKELDSLIKISCPRATKVEYDGGDFYSVYVVDNRAKFGAWMDVAYCEDEDAYTAEWNQYIFSMRDERDIYQKLYQDNWDCFEQFYWAAVNAVEQYRVAA